MELCLRTVVAKSMAEVITESVHGKNGIVILVYNKS